MNKHFTRIIKNENNYIINKGGNNNQNCINNPPNCITKYNMVNNKFTVIKYGCNNKNTQNIKLGNSLNLLNIGDILDMYNIYTFEDLNEYINNNINIDNENKIKRIINIWIKYNYCNIVNNIIIENILLKYFKTFNIKGINSKIINNKIIKEFISYWVDKNSESKFNLDIINDIILYLKKKSKLN
jgi:hypothetical protein